METPLDAINHDSGRVHFLCASTRLVGDTAYGTASMLAWMINDKAIEPHVPVLEKGMRSDETFANSDFQWIEQNNEYRCPAGHTHCAANGVHSGIRARTSPRPTRSSIDQAS